MRDLGLGGYKTIDEFVKAKLDTLTAGEVSFLSLFKMMFREEDNILFERSAGYRIVRTTYGEAKKAAEGPSTAAQTGMPI